MSGRSSPGSAPLTVAWFVPVRHRDYDRMPASVWNRCLQLHPYLERLGVRSLVNDATTRADVAVFVRVQDARALARARAVRARGTRVVLDLCVNYFDVTGLIRGEYGVLERHRDEVLAMTDAADAVTCASAFIAERARRHHGRVVYFPDSVDRAHFRHTKRHEVGAGRPPRAIWCGYGVKAPDLEPVLPLLAARGMSLTVVSEARPRLSQAVDWVRWRHASAPEALVQGDVCVAPRALDTPYDLGHSFFKIGIFLAQGVPALAAPVPSYADVLQPGKTGLVCASPGEWERALDLVLAEPERLAEWGANAVEVMRPWWSENLAGDYARFFRELAGASP
jgi:glycosyltransferase involved in cell wall biosynthesis